MALLVATIEAANAAHVLRACDFGIAPSDNIIGAALGELRDAAHADAALARARDGRGSNTTVNACSAPLAKRAHRRSAVPFAHKWRAST